MSESPAAGAVRFPEGQRPSLRAMHALMAAMTDRVLVYRQPYDLRRLEQLEALGAIYRDEYHRGMPELDNIDAHPVRYLTVINGEPVLWTEAEAPMVPFIVALASGDPELASRFLYRKGLLSS